METYHPLTPSGLSDEEIDRRHRASRIEGALRWETDPAEVRRVREECREAGELEPLPQLDAKLAHLVLEARREALRDAKVLLPAEDLDAIAADKVQDSDAVKRVRKFVAQPPRRMLWLVGTTGAGKSFAAAYGVATHGEGTWTRAARLERAVFPGYGETPSDLHSGLAVLDDLGTGRSRDFDAALLEWTEERLARSEPTIVTSNLGADDLRKSLDARMLDRLRGHAIVIELEGPSMRDQRGGLG